jgi:hypothetical protein
MQKLGTFKVTSGKLRVSDPCYERDTWCAGVLDKVRNGIWNGHVVRVDESCDVWGGIRNAELHAYHSDLNKLPDRWTKTKIDVGVDSGQAGIFDEDKYPQGKHEPERMKEFNEGKFNASFDEFYEACGVQTLGKYGADNGDGYYASNINFKSAGVVNDMGVVSTSGYGDGGYSCYVYKQHGEVVAVKIVFIGKRGRGYEIKEHDVIAKPPPHRDRILDVLDELVQTTKELGQVLDKKAQDRIAFYEYDRQQYHKKVKDVEEWNKKHATYFPKSKEVE